jgi:putative ABC transport system substrate-binding protein
MDRREFVMLVGSAAATAILPSASAQQPTMPAVGFLRNTDADSSRSLVSAFARGLAENGYIERRNLTIEYRWADNHNDRLPELAAELIKRDVAVIVAGGGSVVALSAKSATQTIPIVFELGGDPVKMGLVDSLNRPGGNLTGVALFSNVIGPKRVEILHNLVPGAKTIGFLVQPDNPNAEREIKLARDAASSLGLHLDVLSARSKDEIATAFVKLRQSNAGGLIAMATPLFVANREYLVAQAARDAIPTIYPFSSFVKAGGLVSYGDDLADAFRQVGIYTGRILKGEKPSDLPIVQPSKFELVINLKTAKALGLNVPAQMLALADQVIE